MKIDDYMEYMMATGGDEDAGSGSKNTSSAGQSGCLGSVIIVILAVLGLLEFISLFS